MLWCIRKGSCTGNMRNSVNFTLCCLPKNPGPRFGDLASSLSFHPHPLPHTPACHQQRTLLHSSFRSSQKTSWSRQRWGHFENIGTSSGLWHSTICVTLREARRKPITEHDERGIAVKKKQFNQCLHLTSWNILLSDITIFNVQTLTFCFCAMPYSSDDFFIDLILIFSRPGCFNLSIICWPVRCISIPFVSASCDNIFLAVHLKKIWELLGKRSPVPSNLQDPLYFHLGKRIKLVKTVNHSALWCAWLPAGAPQHTFRRSVYTFVG